MILTELTAEQRRAYKTIGNFRIAHFVRNPKNEKEYVRNPMLDWTLHQLNAPIGIMKSLLYKQIEEIIKKEKETKVPISEDNEKIFNSTDEILIIEIKQAEESSPKHKEFIKSMETIKSTGKGWRELVEEGYVSEPLTEKRLIEIMSDLQKKRTEEAKRRVEAKRNADKWLKQFLKKNKTTFDQLPVSIQWNYMMNAMGEVPVVGMTFHNQIEKDIKDVQLKATNKGLSS